MTRDEAREKAIGALTAGYKTGRSEAATECVADLLLSIDRSARESEWEARGGPELVKAARQTIRHNGCVQGCLFHAAPGNVHAAWCVSLRAALTRTESPATEGATK